MAAPLSHLLKEVDTADAPRSHSQHSTRQGPGENVPTEQKEVISYDIVLLGFFLYFFTLDHYKYICTIDSKDSF